MSDENGSSKKPWYAPVQVSLSEMRGIKAKGGVAWEFALDVKLRLQSLSEGQAVRYEFKDKDEGDRLRVAAFRHLKGMGVPVSTRVRADGDGAYVYFAKGFFRGGPRRKAGTED